MLRGPGQVSASQEAQLDQVSRCVRQRAGPGPHGGMGNPMGASPVTGLASQGTSIGAGALAQSHRGAPPWGWPLTEELGSGHQASAGSIEAGNRLLLPAKTQ